jgi:aldose 1-epimerase
MELTPVKIILALLVLLPASLFGAPGVTSKPFGTCPEGPVELHTLTNANGLSVSIMDYGATVVSVVTPDRFGRMTDIALGFDSPAAYAAATLNFGTMGRYINRIGGGRLTLNGHTYELAKKSRRIRCTAGSWVSTDACGRRRWCRKILRQSSSAG